VTILLPEKVPAAGEVDVPDSGGLRGEGKCVVVSCQLSVGGCKDN
jgi:hypothetical protein